MKRTVERVFRGAPQHWVGDGFHVSNYFPSATETQKRMSPFFLLDYQKAEAFDGNHEAARRGDAPAPGLRDGDDRLRGRDRPSRQRGQRRGDRAG